MTVTAVDVFGNSNQVQRTIVYDLLPTINVTSPPDGSVVRSTVLLSATASDDNPTAAPTTLVMQAADLNGGPILAAGTNTVNTNVFLPDAQIVSLFFKTTDSANQIARAFQYVYVELSSNLVEVARVSNGEITDVQPDRILFYAIENKPGGAGSQNAATRFRLMTKSRIDGSEALLYQIVGTNINSSFLSPQGAVMVINIPPPGYASGAGIYQSRNGTLIQYGNSANIGLGGSLGLMTKGNYSLWGWPANGNDAPQVYLTDLVTTNTYAVPNARGRPWNYEFASNGDVVFIPQNVSPGHAVARYRGGIVTQLATDPINTISYPKTDGSIVCFLKATATNQALMLITNSVETKIAEGVSIGPDFQINGGWVAYTRNGGSGQMQVWRRSPAGVSDQLSFFGSSSTVAALAPNGEVAFYNGLHLYISKGTWPPADIAVSPAKLYNFITPSLKPFWQDGRWYANLGGSLFQIHTGIPQITAHGLSNGQFHLDVMAANGQRVVTQISPNLVDWTDFATNDIVDGANLRVIGSVQLNAPARFYRLRLQ